MNVTRTPNHHPALLSRKQVAFILLLILLVATFFRFWRLEQMPPGFYHDEAYNGLDALSLTQGKTFPQFYEGWELYQNDAHADRPAVETKFPIFFEGNYGREPLHIYLMALSIKLFGATTFAVRAVPAFFGVLAVLTTFLAAREVGGLGGWGAEEQGSWGVGGLGRDGEVVALVAAFVVAVLFPAVHFSRFGLRAMLFVPVETLAVFCFWKGLNSFQFSVFSFQFSGGRGRWALLWFGLAGFLIGGGLYVYAAARLFPLLFAAFFFLLLWRERPYLQYLLLPYLLMAGVALLTALPLLIFFAQYPYFFLFRIAYVSNKGAGTVEGQPLLTWLQNVWRVFAGLFWLGETHLRHNLPGRPYLDPVQAIFFVTGIVSVLKKMLQPRIFFLLSWLIVMLLPTIMSGDAPHFGRMTGAVPIIAIFVGMGVVWLANWVIGLGKVAPKLVWAVLLALLLATAVYSGYDYFVRYANHPQIAADFYLPEWEMGQVAASYPAETLIYLSPTQEELATLYFAVSDPERVRNFAGEQGAVPAGIVGRPSLYLIRPSDSTTLQNIQNRFPEGELGMGTETYLPYFVPTTAQTIQLPNESDAKFGDKIQLLGWDVQREGENLAVTLLWQADVEMAVDYTAFVHLLDGTGTAVSQVDRQPGGYVTSDWRVGERVVDRYLLPIPADLAAGEYRLRTGFYELATGEILGAGEIGDWGVEIGD